MVFIINACDRIDSMTKISVPELTDSNQIKIAIFEDDPLIRLSLKQFLSAQPQLKVVGEAEDGYGAIDCIRQQQGLGNQLSQERSLNNSRRLA
jgi:hypothetical protein